MLHKQYAELCADNGERVEAENEFGWAYSPEAKDLFPRYHVLDAMLVEAERLDASRLPELPELRRRLTEIAGSARSSFTEVDDPVQERAIADERQRTAKLLSELDTTSSAGGEESYHRVLTKLESAELWARVKERWGFAEGHWHPIDGESAAPDAQTFEVPWSAAEEWESAIRGAVASLGYDRVFELRSERIEGGGGTLDAEYETDLDSWRPLYDGGLETGSTDHESRWFLYASHEATLTVCGAELLGAIRKQGLDLVPIDSPG